MCSRTHPLQVANKKQRDIAAQDAEMKQKRLEAAARQENGENNENNAPEEGDSAPADILAAEEDNDVIF